MIPCPNCGTPLVLPNSPRPVESCDCGWYLLGAMDDDPFAGAITTVPDDESDEPPAPTTPGTLPPGMPVEAGE